MIYERFLNIIWFVRKRRTFTPEISSRHNFRKKLFLHSKSERRFNFLAYYADSIREHCERKFSIKLKYQVEKVFKIHFSPSLQPQTYPTTITHSSFFPSCIWLFRDKRRKGLEAHHVDLKQNKEHFTGPILLPISWNFIESRFPTEKEYKCFYSYS